MLNIYAVNIALPITDEQYSYFLSCISDNKLNRIKKFYLLDDAKRALYGDILIRYLICRKFEIGNEELVFGCNKYGKPAILNIADFHYNISHSGNWIVCATSSNRVGIDIERMEPINLDIAKRFFLPFECKNLISKPSDKQTEYFYRLWTLKESYIKYIGSGLSLPLDSFGFDLEKGHIDLCLNIASKPHFRQNIFDKEYMLSICTRGRNIFRDITYVDISNIRFD